MVDMRESRSTVIVTDVVRDVPYETFETPRVHEEMVTAMSHMRRLFKTYATHNIQDALHLRLPPAERAIVVKAHLSGLEFLHKVEIVDGVKVTHFFKAKYLINMMVDVIWQWGLYHNINLEKLDCAFGLTGAAVHNALKVFREGTYEDVEVSADQFYDTYNAIMMLIKEI
ncbi:hypothetical protein BDR06DRAFT_977668 [Suillus hirtellus]|nr:hypothetical protein BDR06DRAFT_977668 [Suillus hirtellus]